MLFRNLRAASKMQALRRFSTGADVFKVEPLDNGVYMFKMNRPKQRNAISMDFVAQFSDAIR